MFKLLLLAVFAAIVISLFRALYFLVSETKPSHHIVNALAVRVLLSVLLVGLLLIGFFSGQLQPHGL
jgi:hypothetical protein